jgi:hypothetical protein
MADSDLLHDLANGRSYCRARRGSVAAQISDMPKKYKNAYLIDAAERFRQRATASRAAGDNSDAELWDEAALAADQIRERQSGDTEHMSMMRAARRARGQQMP